MQARQAATEFHREKQTELKIGDRLDNFKSEELVLALAGPIGCNLNLVSDTLSESLTQNGYKIHYIKVTTSFASILAGVSEDRQKVILDGVQAGFDGTSFHFPDAYQRIIALQDIGNNLRKFLEPTIIAQKIISEIAQHRAENAQRSQQYKEYLIKHALEDNPEILFRFSTDVFKPGKIAYIVNQLKNPAEVHLLRQVYSELFYLIGGIENKKTRIQALESRFRRISHHGFESKAASVEERDKGQSEKHEQQLEKTLQLADYFVYMAALNQDGTRNQVNRFLRLAHNQGIITPTQDELGMYMAHSAGLTSSCLSRQVGAAIIDNGGNVISTGANEVPKFGGGPYNGSEQDDNRCFNFQGFCRNDDQKGIIFDSLHKFLETQGIPVSEDQLRKGFKQSGISDLIEFSRAVHAEMAAIISAGKRGANLDQSVLYSTTFPCHNCAKHIVASGISKVVYIEPYEKSKAIQLHQDSISLEDTSPEKVAFAHFHGVAPRRYQSFFHAAPNRKDDTGHFQVTGDFNHASPEYLEGYRGLEVRVNKHYNEKISQETPESS